MRPYATVGNVWVVGALLSISLPFTASAADPHKIQPSIRYESASSGTMTRLASASPVLFRRGGKGSMEARGPGGGLQCVAFARAATGIELSGNAVDWWDHAAGIYQRGNRPEPGAILNFRANARMRMGHVAVVTSVNNSREVEIDHANWSAPGPNAGRVSRAITVVDVSPNNDWSAVRVELGHSDDFGSIYPTFGFIYDRAEKDPAPAPTVVAAAAPIPNLNPAPADLRGSGTRIAGRLSRRSYDEVAEAPTRRGIDLSVGSQFSATPNRSFR